MEKEDLRDKLSFRKILAHYKIKSKITRIGNGEFATKSPWSRHKKHSLLFHEYYKRFWDIITDEEGDVFTFIARVEQIDCYSRDGFICVLKIADKIVRKSPHSRRKK